MGLFGNKKKKNNTGKTEKADKKAYTEIKVVQGKMASAAPGLATEMQEIKAESETVARESVKQTEPAEQIQENVTNESEQPSDTAYSSMHDTAPLPELDIPSHVFEQEPQSALQESRDYIAILLKDLEEVRQENEQLRIPKQEKNPWKAFAVILALVIVAGMVGFLWFYTFVYRKAIESGNIGPVPTATPALIPGAQKNPKEDNTYIIKDLAAYVSGLPEGATAGFKASAEEYFGYEYLCLSAGGVKVFSPS